MKKNKTQYSSIRESELFDEILTNLIKFNFKYRVDENRLTLFSDEKETLTYCYPGLLKNLKQYLSHKLG